MPPAELFFYIFLPPLLLDAAVRIDFFLFKKVCPPNLSVHHTACLLMHIHSEKTLGSFVNAPLIAFKSLADLH